MANLNASTNCGVDYDVLNNASLPDEYKQLPEEVLDRRITEAKAKLGKRLVILGHHYQRDEIIKYADYRGDSLKLSQLAAQRKDAEFIVFCGVHFMAESADILSAKNQIVILPNLEAGCSMADMANIGQVETCWQELEEAGVINPASGMKSSSSFPTPKDTIGVIPITYINSSANLKAFVGKHGGAVCTSSNAKAIVSWALNHPLAPSLIKEGELKEGRKERKILFFPDQHLGRITCLGLGIPLTDMVLWNPFEYMGGYEPADLQKAKVLLWKGHCSVHMRFKLEQVEKARREYPGIRVIVHPECTLDVVQAADEYGSTEVIYRRIKESPAGSKWAVGTEVNLVNRMQEEMPDKTIFCLDPVVCPCETMYRIHPSYLCWVLENLVQGRVVNQIKVPDEIKQWAKVALDRMLEIR